MQPYHKQGPGLVPLTGPALSRAKRVGFELYSLSLKLILAVSTIRKDWFGVSVWRTQLYSRRIHANTDLQARSKSRPNLVKKPWCAKLREVRNLAKADVFKRAVDGKDKFSIMTALDFDQDWLGWRHAKITCYSIVPFNWELSIFVKRTDRIFTSGHGLVWVSH